MLNLARYVRFARLTAGGAIALMCLLAVNSVAAEPALQPAPTPAVTCTQPTAGVQIRLDNPSPGDTLQSGSNVVLNGAAWDPASTSGPGVSAVRVYLGDRSAGGISLGTATLGQANPQAPAGSQISNAGFSLRSSTLPAGSGARTLFIYAQSSVSDAEGVLQVPIFLNAAPTPVKGGVPTAVLPTPPACTPTPVPTVVPTSTPTTVPLPTLPPAIVVPATATPPAVPTPPLPLPPVAAPAAAAPAPAAVAPAAVAAPAPAPAAAQTTAPRGGGIPNELGFGIIATGALILAGGWAIRRRERHSAAQQGDTSTPS